GRQAGHQREDPDPGEQRAGVQGGQDPQGRGQLTTNHEHDTGPAADAAGPFPWGDYAPAPTLLSCTTPSSPSPALTCSTCSGSSPPPCAPCCACDPAQSSVSSSP